MAKPMREMKSTRNIIGYKPVMKTLASFKALNLQTNMQNDNVVVMVKCDGEFTLAVCEDQTAYTINRWGTMRTDFPAVNELAEALEKRGVTAEILCELHAYDFEKDRPLKLPEFQKGNGTVRIGAWDLLSVNGKEVRNSSFWKLQELHKWFGSCRYIYVLPFIKPRSTEEVRMFWDLWVRMKGYEGLVARISNSIYKIKPISDVDAVIVGINKRTRFYSQEVTSLKLALMEEDGTFVELGDVASGIDHQLRKALWHLMDYKVAEDKETVWIKPFVIVTIEYTDIFIRESRRFTYDGEKYHEAGKRTFATLKEPRLTRLRSDKTVNPQDLRTAQIPL